MSSDAIAHVPFLFAFFWVDKRYGDVVPTTEQHACRPDNLSHLFSFYCFNSTRISSTSSNCSPEWVTGGRICASSFFVSTTRVVPSARVYRDFPPLIKYTTNGG